MRFITYKKPVTLGILFFLPVIFLLFLYPSTHNYNTLDVVDEKVAELSNLYMPEGDNILLNDHITILCFLGNDPYSKAISALNLKELIYDKFKGFKRFQIVVIVKKGSENSVKELQKELFQYDELKYWHFIYGDDNDIITVYESLLSKNQLDDQLSTDEVFIIDKELKQRGRIDDRTDYEKKRNEAVYGLVSYNCIEVAELKNKMSEDVRILFTEYRQKRKGNFESSTRREQELKSNEEN